VVAAGAAGAERAAEAADVAGTDRAAEAADDAGADRAAEAAATAVIATADATNLTRYIE
jgi:hypothetical protein